MVNEASPSSFLSLSLTLLLILPLSLFNGIWAVCLRLHFIITNTVEVGRLHTPYTLTTPLASRARVLQK
jgi:hypothetical protein